MTNSVLCGIEDVRIRAVSAHSEFRFMQQKRCPRLEAVCAFLLPTPIIRTMNRTLIGS